LWVIKQIYITLELTYIRQKMERALLLCGITATVEYTTTTTHSTLSLGQNMIRKYYCFEGLIAI
jgi:hypothetical protein